MSTIEAGIFVDFYNRRWLLGGADTESNDLALAKENLRRRGDLAIDVAKARERMFSTLGRARTSFERTTDLLKLTNYIFRQNPPAIRGDPSTMDAQALEKWKTNSLENLKVFVEHEYGGSLDKLLSYLEKQLPDQ